MVAGTAPPELAGTRGVMAVPTVKTLVVGLYEMLGACAEARVIPKYAVNKTPKYNNIFFENGTVFLLFGLEVKYFFYEFLRLKLMAREFYENIST